MTGVWVWGVSTWLAPRGGPMQALLNGLNEAAVRHTQGESRMCKGLQTLDYPQPAMPSDIHNFICLSMALMLYNSGALGSAQPGSPSSSFPVVLPSPQEELLPCRLACTRPHS